MVQVGVAELKARLSEYLARARAGEEIVVADRGRPVARLVPTTSVGLEGEDSRLWDLQRRGLVRIGAAALPASFWEHERPEDPEGTVRAALEAERGEGR
jgi:prevent-host-death family protein